MLFSEHSNGTRTVASTSNDLSASGRAAFGQSSMGFRDYEVWPAARLLLRSGEVVCIGSRAFDLLVVLLRSRGSVVPKQEIVKHVWPSTIVDESNLRFQVATLRSSLGKDRDLIKSVAGQGYIFVCDPKSPSQPVAVDPLWAAGTVGSPDAMVENPAEVQDRFHAISIGQHPGDEKLAELFERFVETIVVAYGSIDAARDALSR